MLGNANMSQIVRRNVKNANMSEVIRHAKMCKGVLMHAKECQGKKGINKLNYKEMTT